MKTFLQVSLVVLLAAAACVFAPHLVGAVGGGLFGGLVALFVLAVLCLLALVLAVVVGGAALIAVVIGLVVAAIVVLAVLSPVWVPLLLLGGTIAMLVKLSSRPRTPTAPPPAALTA